MKGYITKREWEEKHGKTQRVCYYAPTNKSGTRGYDRRYDPNPLLPMPVLRQMLANQSEEAKQKYDSVFSNTSPERSRRDDWRTEDRPTTRMLGVGRSG